MQTKSTSKEADGKPKYDGVVDAIQKIYKNEGGLTAFYNGLASDTANSVINSFLFFLAYNLLWRMRKKYGPAAENPMIQALEGIGVGFAAGAFTKGLTSPIQNVVTKQQTQSADEEQSVTEIANDIYKKKGIAGFWSGYSSSLILTFNPAITFFLDAFLSKVLRRAGNEPGPATTFILAANGKSCANVITYPFKIVKSRAQVSAPESQSESPQSSEKAPSDGSEEKRQLKPRNPLASIAHIARTEGVASLYAGVWGELFKGFFSHGLTMLVKEQIPALVLQLYYLLAMLLRRQSKMKA